MSDIKNIRRVALEKKQKTAEEAIEFISVKPQKNLILEIIENNTSTINNDYFEAISLLSILEKPVEGVKNLLQLKEKYLLISLLDKSDLLFYISEIEEKYNNNFSIDNVLDFFSDFQDLKKIKSSYRKIKEEFLLKRKKASKMYSTALNATDSYVQLDKLEKALRVSPWGSVEALRIIQSIILIEKGKKLGKNSFSKNKEKENQ